MTQKNTVFLNNFGDLAQIQRSSYYHFLLSGFGDALQTIENPFWTLIFPYLEEIPNQKKIFSAFESNKAATSFTKEQTKKDYQKTLSMLSLLSKEVEDKKKISFDHQIWFIKEKKKYKNKEIADQLLIFINNQNKIRNENFKNLNAAKQALSLYKKSLKSIEKQTKIGEEDIELGVPCLTYLYPSDLQFEAPYTLHDCFNQAMTYSLWVFLRAEYTYTLAPISKLTYLSHKSKDKKKKRIQQLLLLTELPLLTQDGTFIINGHERVVISQIIRSPGVYFRKYQGIGAKKVRYVATIISERGNWTRIYFGREYEEKRLIDKVNFREKILQKSRHVKSKELWEKYFHPETRLFEKLDAAQDEIYIKPSEFRRKTRLDLERDKEDQNDKKDITHEIDLLLEGIQEYEDDKIYLMHIADALEKNMFFLFKSLIYIENVKNISNFNENEYENILAGPSNEFRDKEEQKKKNTYNKNWTSHVLEFDEILLERFCIGKAGRWRLNKKLGLNIPLEVTVLTIHDFLKIIDALFELKYFNRLSDDIDHLKNKMVRSIGELLELQIQVGIYRLVETFSSNLDDGDDEEYDEDVETDIYEDEVYDLLKKDDIHLRYDLDKQYYYLFEKSIKKKYFPKLKKKLKQHLAEQTEEPDIFNENLSSLIDPRILTSTLKEFFTTSQLSQFMDQINLLADVTQKRKISVFGPNGLKRDNVSNKIRDIHSSQYGRFCPIDTPEGKNAGLVSSLSLWSKVNQWGAVETPYFLMNEKFLYRNISPIYIDPEKEAKLNIAFCDESFEAKHDISQISSYSANSSSLSLEGYQEKYFSVKQDYLFSLQKSKDISFMTTSPLQLMSLGTALIPFVEHNDANRALMGSNMQRQAVPFLISQKALVGTGLEAIVCLDSGMTIKNYAEGKVTMCTSTKIAVEDISGQVIYYSCYKYRRSNQNTALSQRPFVWIGEKVYSGQIIADTTSSNDGELAVGQNLTIAYMPWEGYNYEDAIVLNERLLFDNVLTSIHLEEYETEINISNYRYSNERLTSFLPYPLPRIESCQLSPDGLIRLGSYVHEHDVLIGKVRLAEHDNSGERKLIEALFPETAVDRSQPLYKDQSLRVEIGTEGRVVDIRVLCPTSLKAHNFSQHPIKTFEKSNLLQKKWESVTVARKLDYMNWKTDKPKKLHTKLIEFFQFIQSRKNRKNLQQIQKEEKQIGKFLFLYEFFSFEEREIEIQNLKEKMHYKIEQLLSSNGELLPFQQKDSNNTLISSLKTVSRKKSSSVQTNAFQELKNNFGIGTKEVIFKDDALDQTDFLLFPEIRIRIFIAQIRKIEVGDKLAGRHGNKGIISRILSPNDMPYLQDGTPVDIVLNPLGVPSRMNVGQIFESLLGLAAEKLGTRFKVIPFDEMYSPEASRLLINQKLKQAAIKQNNSWVFDFVSPGKMLVRDGRTGDYFDNSVTVGKSYILKLIHIVEEKINARATGPYAIVTEQPLAGKSKNGGQRFGEMEVWALEAYGCSHTLQELLTIKSDDIDGRTDMYQSLSLAGNLPKPSPSIPEAFLLLIRELNALGLNLSFEEANLDVPKKKSSIQTDIFRVMEIRLYLRAVLIRKKVLAIANLSGSSVPLKLWLQQEKKRKQAFQLFTSYEKKSKF